MTKALPADAGVPSSLLETPWCPSPQDRLGFYGCGGAGLVRIALRGKKGHKPPRAVTVDCPACGGRHLVRPAWRRPVKLDEGREPDVVLDLAEFAEDGAEADEGEEP